jgi:hypothetical protein
MARLGEVNMTRNLIARARAYADHCIAYGQQTGYLPAIDFNAHGGYRAHCAHDYAEAARLIAVRVSKIRLHRKNLRLMGA